MIRKSSISQSARTGVPIAPARPRAEPSAAFTLDTSGAVEFDNDPMPGMATYVMWENLGPFPQGYIEAMLRDPIDVSVNLDPPAQMGVLCGFSDLAHETLEAIRKDCAARVLELRALNPGWGQDAAEGARLWMERQAGALPHFRPLTPYLGEDGKIYLRSAA